MLILRIKNYRYYTIFVGIILKCNRVWFKKNNVGLYWKALGERIPPPTADPLNFGKIRLLQPKVIRESNPVFRIDPDPGVRRIAPKM